MNVFKVNYFYLLLIVITASCSKDSPSEGLLNEGQLDLSLSLIREFNLQLESSSGKSVVSENSDFVHVFDDEITVNFTSVPAGNNLSLTFNPNDTSSAQTVILPYGQYNWEILNKPNPVAISNFLAVSGQSTQIITINEPIANLSLNVNTDYALVTVNDDYTTTVTLTHENLSISMNNKDGYNYGYVLAGTTSTILDVVDINADNYISNLGLIESCKHYKYQLNYSTLGVNSLICLCEPFEIVERFLAPIQSNVFCEKSDLPESLRNGLLGMWTFCGDANDQGSLSNNGTVYGPINEEGKFDQSNTSYSFDGKDDYIALNEPFFNGKTSVASFTFYALFKVNELNSSIRHNIFTKEGYWRTVSLSVGTDQTIGFGGSNPNPQSYWGVSSDLICETDTWYNVVVTFNQGTLKMYINGNLNKTEIIRYSTIDWSYLARGNSTSTTHIGNALAAAGPKHQLDGLVDDLMYWDRVLSSDEINVLNR